VFKFFSFMSFKFMALFILLYLSPALAQQYDPNPKQNLELVNQGADFQITHYTIDSGYEEISGGDFFMRGIVGQPDTGISQGSKMVFTGGFLHAGAPLVSEFLLIDGFESIPQFQNTQSNN